MPMYSMPSCCTATPTWHTGLWSPGHLLLVYKALYLNHRNANNTKHVLYTELGQRLSHNPEPFNFFIHGREQ